MVKMVVLIGDSQMVGFNQSKETLPDELAHFDYGQTYMWGGSWWGGIIPGLNTAGIGATGQPGAWGPELGVFKSIREEFGPDELILGVKIAHGGTHTTGEWEKGGKWYELAKQEIKEAMASGNYGPPDAVFVVLGSNDAFVQSEAANYQDTLTGLFADIREEWMQDPFGYIGFSRIGNSTSMTYNELVRIGQWTVDQLDPYAESIKTIGFGVQSDGYHHNADGLLSVGKGLATNWLDEF